MDKKYTNSEYLQYVDEKAPKTTMFKNMLRAFLVGGVICVIAQAILEFYKAHGLDEITAASVLTITMIFLGAFLTGIGVYDKIAKFAGAGTIVPITGFANAIVSPAMEFKTEGYVLGVGAKMFLIAGPVIVFGTVISVLTGICYFLFV